MPTTEGQSESVKSIRLILPAYKFSTHEVRHSWSNWAVPGGERSYAKMTLAIVGLRILANPASSPTGGGRAADRSRYPGTRISYAAQIAQISASVNGPLFWQEWNTEAEIF